MRGLNKGLSVLCAVIVVAALWYGRTLVLAQPGDTSDPLVSKSYVDSQIEKLRLQLTGQTTVPSGGTTGASLNQSETDAVVAEVLAYVETVYGDLLRQVAATADTAEGGQIVPYEAVFAEKGRTLIAYSGTEIILRGGSAVAVTGINGMCDVTVGADITNGTAVPLNHLLIVPASDGRGMTFTADAYLMIKGAYYFTD